MENHPLLLLIETTSKKCSVALSQGDQLTVSIESEEEFSHAKQLASLCSDLCNNAGIRVKDLDAYAISGGPGSYTGLRIGFSFVKGLAMATAKPIIKVDTLDALMSEAKSRGFVADYYHVGIDARRMEAYTKVYDKNGAVCTPLTSKIYDEEVLKEINALQDDLCFLGTANEKLSQVINPANANFKLDELSASYLVSLAYDKWLKKEYENIFFLTPTYLKPPNITRSKKSYFA